MSIKLELQKLLKLIKSDKTNDLIIIYQMGKVGSQTLKNSILKSGYDCLNLYSLRGPTLAYISRNIKYNNRRLIFLGGLRQKLYSYLLQRYNKKKIITIVRDPVARDISLIYHFFSVFIYNTLGQSTSEEFTLQDVVQQIYDNNIIHGSAVSWLEQELNKTLGINIYDYPFDKEKGFVRIKQNNLDILVLTLEKLSENEKTIADFLGSEDFILENFNASARKWYSEIYSLTKDKIKINAREVEAAYMSKFMRHFYSAEDIAKNQNKWLGV